MIQPSHASPEVELKFLLSPDEVAAVSATPIFAHKTTHAQLRSVYYDTPDWDLRRGGVSLRVRLREGVFIQTVKRQAGLSLFDRDEWESEVNGEDPDPLAWAGTPVASILTAKGADALGPVFSTTVQRTIRLLDEGACLVEASLDQGELVAGKRREPIEEVELELKAGDAAALFGVARRLAAAAVLRLSFDSKAERGYRLVGQNGLTAVTAQAAKIPSDMAAVEGFTQVARSCLVQVSANAHLLRRVRNPEVLHELRVGLRRLRAALATFRPIFSRKGRERLKRETKWLAGELDPARDLDVFITSTFHSAEADAHRDPMLAAFGERLLRAQTMAYDRALAAVDSKRFARLLLDCAEWVQAAPWQRDDDPAVARLRDGAVSVLAAQALTRLRRQLRKSGKHLATLDPAGRHQVRIKAKTLRYAGEFFTETFGKRTHKRRRKFIASLQALQNALGELSDLATAHRMVLVVVGCSAEVAFRAGQVVGGRDRDEPQLLATAVQAYERWRRARPFWR